MYEFGELGAMKIDTPEYYDLGNKVDPKSQVLPSKVYYVKTKYTLRDLNGAAWSSLPKGTKVVASDFTTELPGKGSVKYRIVYAQYGQGPDTPKDGGKPVTGGFTGLRGLIAASGLQPVPPAGYWGKPGQKVVEPANKKPAGLATGEKPPGEGSPLLLIAAAVAAYYFLG